jgi:hypothetical protein
MSPFGSVAMSAASECASGPKCRNGSGPLTGRSNRRNSFPVAAVSPALAAMTPDMPGTRTHASESVTKPRRTDLMCSSSPTSLATVNPSEFSPVAAIDRP